MLNALRSEIFRVTRRPMPLILLGVVAGVIALLYLLLWLSLEGAQDVITADEAGQIEEMLALSEVAVGGGGLVYLVAAIMAVILGASIIATEYNWGTIRTILPRTAGRAAFLSAKLVTLLGFTLVAVLVGFAAAFASAAIVSTIADLDRTLGGDFAVDLVRSIGAAFAVILPYVALSFMVGMLARSTAAGVGLGLAVFFLEGQLIQLISAAGGIVETATEFLLAPNVNAVLAVATDTPADIAAWRGLLVLAVYTATFLAIAFWRFERRDVVAG